MHIKIFISLCKFTLYVLTRPSTATQGGETHFFDRIVESEGVEKTSSEITKKYSQYFSYTEEEWEGLVGGEREKGSFQSLPFFFETSPAYFVWPGDLPQYVPLQTFI